MDELRPILVSPIFIEEQKIVFLNLDKKITIINDLAVQIKLIINHANGFRTVNEIAKLCNIDVILVEKIIRDLINLEIMTDSRQQFRHFCKLSKYPDIYQNLLNDQEIVSQHDDGCKYLSGTLSFSRKKINFQKCNSLLWEVINKRHSCRSFSSEQLTIDQLGSICSFAYDRCCHKTPSAGGLYPLKLFLVIVRNQASMLPGYYEYDSNAQLFIWLNKEFDEIACARMFDSESTPYNASVVLIIAADCNLQTQKYGNRGFIYTVLEAGHVAQNVNIFCAEQNIGCLELGGFDDEKLSQELELKKHIIPIICLALGKESDKKVENVSDLLHQLKKEYVGEKKEITNSGLTKITDAPFFGGFARINSEIIAGATSTCTAVAQIKSIVEGVERHACIFARPIFHAQANKLKFWLDPRIYQPMSVQQQKHLQLTSFEETMSLGWVLGIDVSGNTISVPVDMIRYGNQYLTSSGDKYRRICLSNSSGAAAHLSIKSAKRCALLELIERDALMRNWFERKSPAIIHDDLLSPHLLKRSKYWREKGRELFVLYLSSKAGVVIQTIIVGSTYPFFMCGCSASEWSFLQAAHKAMQETEYGLYIALANNIPDKICPETVVSPADHGLLYCFPDYIDNISWLWKGEYIKKLPEIKPVDDSFECKLQIVTVNLTPKDSMVKVVKIFSPYLIPINFGYGSDVYLHQEVQKLSFNKESQLLPHYFA